MGGATTIGPDATHPPATCQNWRGGGGGGGGGGGSWPGGGGSAGGWFGLVWVKACAGRPGPWSALAFVPTRLG